MVNNTIGKPDIPDFAYQSISPTIRLVHEIPKLTH